MKSFQFFFPIFLFLFSTSLLAQTEVVKETNTRIAIQELKEGALIVRLPSHAKKIAAMEELIQDKSVSKRNKENLKRQVTLIKQEAKLRNEAIVNGFTTAYDFSDVLFIYDSDTKALQGGKTQGIFLNEKLEIDNSIELQERPYLFVRFGQTDLSTTTGVEGMIITDKNLVDLRKPFPFYVREGGIRYLMDKIFDKKNADMRNMPRMAAKLNGNLKDYFDKMNY